MIAVLLVCCILLFSSIALVFSAQKTLLIISLISAAILSLVALIWALTKQRRVSKKTIAETAYTDTDKKADYLAKISHDLRTPLHGITGLIEIVKNEDLSPTVKRYVEQMEVSSNMLLGVISDAIDLSQNLTHEMTLRSSSFRLLTVCENVTRIFAQRANAKNITLNLHFDSRLLQEYIESDPQRLNQILYNLLGNAFKYTDSGDVSLWVILRQHANNEFAVRFVVEDTGIGMEQDDADKIFEEFYQVESSQSGRVTGSGLGLKITGDLIKLLGGEIQVKSALNYGSKFQFDLVFQKSTQNDAPVFRVCDPEKEMVLISERGTVSESIISCIEGLGAHVKHFDTVELSLTSESDVTSSVLIVELDSVKNIDDANRLASHLKPAFQYLLVSDDQVQNYPHWDLLFKPFLPSDMIKLCLSSNVLSTVLTTAQDQIDNVSLVKKLSSEHEHLQILIADDIEINQVVLSQLLKQLGFKNIKCVANGKEVIQQVSNSEVNIVFMDFDMPVLDGIEASKLLREKNYDGKIFGITAASDSKLFDKAMQFMDLVITKPVTLEKLAQFIFKHLFDRYPNEDEWVAVAKRLNSLSKNDGTHSVTKILLASTDERARSKFVRVTKQSAQFAVSVVNTATDISLALQRRPYEILVLDTSLPFKDIEQLVLELAQRRVSINVALLFETPTCELVAKFKQDDIHFIPVMKPLTPTSVCDLLEKATQYLGENAFHGRQTKLTSEEQHYER
jgi:signal transduction histidine kinase/CheY-like chemotaxis protein/BarA-like signal transduction histidine kinase